MEGRRQPAVAVAPAMRARPTMTQSGNHGNLHIRHDAVTWDNHKFEIMRGKSPEKSSNWMFIGPVLAAVAILLIASAGMISYKMQRVARAEPKFVIPIEEWNLQGYPGKLDEAVESLEKSWEEASPVVQKAFSKYFMPSFSEDDEAPQDVMGEFKKHIKAMKEVKQPEPNDSKEEKEVYVSQMQLLTSACNAAASRLRALSKIESKAAEGNFPVYLLDMLGTSLPSLEGLKAEPVEAKMTFQDFAGAVGARAGVTGHVHKELVTRLAAVLKAHDAFVMEGKAACLLFEPYLDFFELSLERSAKEQLSALVRVPTPHDELPFPTGTFFNFLHYRHNNAKYDMLTNRFFEKCAEDWADDNVYKQLQEVERIERTDDAKS